jgi:fructan beta-fructosidase
MTDMAFSGSAVMDKNNTSGWGTKNAPPMVLAYTSTGRGECIAYSTDRGHSWTEYEKNPVVKHAGRDPKLVWYAPGKHWVMAVYDEGGGKRGIAFYSSPDLKTWTFQSKIDDFFECPDLFELAEPGTKGARKWVLYAADGRYLVGSFDGKKFTKESNKQQLWYGNFYAAQTFDNAEANERVQFGWAQGVTFPGMPFNQQMTVPVQLSLLKAPDGVWRMWGHPWGLLDFLRGETVFDKDRQADVRVGKEPVTLMKDVGEAEVRLTFPTSDTTNLRLNLRGLEVIYDGAKKEVRCGKIIVPVVPLKGHVDLNALIDRGSVEVFVNEGMSILSIAHIARDGQTSVTASGDAMLEHVSWWRLRTAWK